MTTILDNLFAQKRYVLKYGDKSMEWSAKEAQSKEELADILEEMVAMLRAPVKRYTDDTETF